MNLLMIANPYVSFCVAFASALTLYSSDLVSLFPEISWKTYLLILLCISLSLSSAFFFRSSIKKIKHKTQYTEIKLTSFLIFKVLLGLSIFEIVLHPNIPLLMVLNGAALDHKEFVTDYGIPTFHALIVILCQVVIVQGACELLFSSDRKLTSWIAMIGGFILLIAFLSRGAIVIAFLAIIYSSFLKYQRIQFFRLITLTGIAIISIYLFGWVGDLRTGDSTYLASISGANEDIFGKIIPKELLWIYMYLVSPIANLQLSVDSYQQISRLEIYPVFVMDILPDVLSKRISDFLDIWQSTRPLIHSAFTASTMLSRPYHYAGFLGALTVFLWWMIVTYISISFTQKTKYFSHATFGFTNVLGFLCVFSNTTVFSSIIGPIVFFVIIDMILRVRINSTHKIGAKNAFN